MLDKFQKYVLLELTAKERLCEPEQSVQPSLKPVQQVQSANSSLQHGQVLDSSHAKHRINVR